MDRPKTAIMCYGIGLLLLGSTLLLAGCTHHASGRISEDESPDPWQGVALPSISADSAPDAANRPRATDRRFSASPRTEAKDLLPAGVRDPDGWSRDIMTATKTLAIPQSPENLCAIIAVIAQESSFQAEPVIAGLPRIIRNELEKRRAHYHVPKAVVEAALAMKSPDGRRYEQRLQALRTENDLNRLYDDMLSALPLGKTLFGRQPLVRTGGPMQVSLAFAQQEQNKGRYPYPMTGSLRDEVFSRRGGVYFGIANLLDYPSRYDRMLYRFADYNAGRYSSRNAGFQAAIRRLGGHSLSLDGDLLRYDEAGHPQANSETLEALRTLSPPLPQTEAELRHDLGREKEADFDQTALWLEIDGRQTRQGGGHLKPQVPEIRLISPKITSGLTTQGFAQRVDRRYQDCLARSRRARSD